MRGALRDTLNRAQIINATHENTAYPIKSFLKNNTEYSEDDISKDTARTLLQKIASTTLTITVPSIPFLERAAEEIKTEWEAAGIAHVLINRVEPEEIMKTIVAPRAYEILLIGITQEHENDLFPFFHSSERTALGLNLALYQNQESDRIFETIRQTFDEEKRIQLTKKASEILTGDVPAIPLFSLPYIYLHTRELEGFKEQWIQAPEDRFVNITDWHIAKVRILK